MEVTKPYEFIGFWAMEDTQNLHVGVGEGFCGSPALVEPRSAVLVPRGTQVQPQVQPQCANEDREVLVICQRACSRKAGPLRGGPLGGIVY